MAKSLRQRMQDGEVLTAMRGSLSTRKTELAAMWATGRYDYIWIDSQHTPYSDQLLVDYCQAAGELGIDVQLRIPHTRQAHMVGRFLDFGLTAVLVPEVEEPETVDDAIAYAYYGPIGRRSWGGSTRKGFSQGVDRHEYSAWWNDTVVLGIQVESVEAVTSTPACAMSPRSSKTPASAWPWARRPNPKSATNTSTWALRSSRTICRTDQKGIWLCM